MNWKLLVALGALTGGVVYAARRKQREQAEATPWADATDRVTRFGT